MSFVNCSFAGGKLDKIHFIGYADYKTTSKELIEYGLERFIPRKYYSSNKVENCDFTSAQLKDVDFTVASLKNSKFNDADIQNVNFAGKVSFQNPITHQIHYRQIGNQLRFSDKSVALSVYCERSIISMMKTHGLQKEQLESTASFKKKKLLGNKFCMDMEGLNLSQFNLTGCQFSGNLANVNFIDAVITDCVLVGIPI
ncbi:MAG: pentapeptide repeat-containing protein [Planctomycetaceae bacterium]|jgi:uncharacterized protein YjbI with pentapeptide repeats|nr:pentapeptide repeat-containing protein [Planctomycetaceae bacterium]